MKSEELLKMIKEEYKLMKPLFQEKQKLIKELNALAKSYVDYDELEELSEPELLSIWDNLIGGPAPSYKEIIYKLYNLAKDEGLNIYDLKNYATVEELDETNGLGISYTVKKSVPREQINETVLRKNIRNILKNNIS